MLNSASFVGRLGQVPELKQIPAGKSVLSGSLAVGRNFKNQAGEYETDWIDFQVWGKTAEYLAQYAGKGSLVSMSGEMRTRTYDNQHGNKVKVTELVSQNVQVLQAGNQQTNNTQSDSNYLGATEIQEDDLPF